MDDELLRTLMCEIENILNSRPISLADMSSTNQLEALTPSSLLTQKYRVVLPFSGRFAALDVYARQRWRQMQHLSNVFWSRWRREIVLAAQERRKWQRTTPNFETNDVVLIMDADHPYPVDAGAGRRHTPKQRRPSQEGHRTDRQGDGAGETGPPPRLGSSEA